VRTGPAAVRTLVAPGTPTEIIGLEVAEIPAGASLTVRREGELLAVVLCGVVDVILGGERLGRAGGRRSVFEGPGHAAYLPPSTAVVFAAMSRPVEVALVTALLDDAPAAAPRLIGPGDQQIAERGTGSFARTVRTFLGPGDAAGRLLVGETLNPPGNWSTYPPHKHDEHRPPVEARLEEVYLFKVSPPGGFGIQIRYDDRTDECRLVRDGDVAVIRSGYHTVVAAAGYTLYYLWIMAGGGREPLMYVDPAHAWVEARP
jgi:5-deoxy-glucuronate isomerase